VLVFFFQDIGTVVFKMAYQPAALEMGAENMHGVSIHGLGGEPSPRDPILSEMFVSIVESRGTRVTDAASMRAFRVGFFNRMAARRQTIVNRVTIFHVEPLFDNRNHERQLLK
jgi:hypothetical protein